MNRLRKEKERLGLGVNSGVELFERGHFSDVYRDSASKRLTDDLFFQASLSERRGRTGLARLVVPAEVDLRNGLLWLAATLTEDYGNLVGLVTLPITTASDESTKLACHELRSARIHRDLGIVLLQEGASIFPDQAARTEQIYSAVRHFEIPVWIGAHTLAPIIESVDAAT